MRQKLRGKAKHAAQSIGWIKGLEYWLHYFLFSWVTFFYAQNKLSQTNKYGVCVFGPKIQTNVREEYGAWRWWKWWKNGLEKKRQKTAINT